MTRKKAVPTNDKIPYSEDEIAYILRHIGPGPEHQSWGRLAYPFERWQCPVCGREEVRPYTGTIDTIEVH